MKAIRILIMTTAFLIMVSSALSLLASTDRTPVYVNVAAMICLVIVVSLLNFKVRKEKSQQ